MDRYNTALCFISIEKVKIMDQNRVYFFDTTLRDGEQTPGVSLQTPEKIEIAKGLVRLGIECLICLLCKRFYFCLSEISEKTASHLMFLV